MGKREIAGVLAMKKCEVKLHAREIFHKLGVEGWRELAGPASDRSL